MREEEGGRDRGKEGGRKIGGEEGREGGREHFKTDHLSRLALSSSAAFFTLFRNAASLACLDPALPQSLSPTAVQVNILYDYAREVLWQRYTAHMHYVIIVQCAIYNALFDV